MSDHQAFTHRTLQQATLAELRAMARDRQLPVTGRKSALVDRLYRHQRLAARAGDPSPSSTPIRPSTAQTPRRTRRVPSPDEDVAFPPPQRSPRERSPRRPRAEPLTADLEHTVQDLVDRSPRGLEDRLLHSLRPFAPADAGNISLPSPGGPPSPRAGVARRANADADELPQAPKDAENAAAVPPYLAPLLYDLPPSTRQPPVPPKVRQRIVKGEYVEFDTLLRDALFPARHGTTPAPSLSFRVSHDESADGKMVISQGRPTTRRTICDLPTWMEAWNVYVAVLVAHFPARAPALLAYQRIICDASQHFEPRHWLLYDTRFRACAAEDQTLHWDVKHGDLWLECFTRSAREPAPQPSRNPLGRTPCTYCGGLYHFPDNCPSHPFRGPRRHGAPFPPKSYPPIPSSSITPHPTPGRTQPPAPPAGIQHMCRDFNSQRGCTRHICRFRHACTRCGDPSHRERICSRPPPHPPSH